jgi:hypothetical protein
MSFPLPDLASLPAILDHFVENEAGVRLLEFPNASGELYEQLAAGTLYFGNSDSTRKAHTARARLSTPVPSHVATEYTGGPDDLMTPQAQEGQASHAPGPLVRGVLQQLGWKLAPVAARANE